MPSNTSKGRGKKGSKFWIQTLVNLDDGKALSKAIKDECREVGEIAWLSPLYKDNYEEMKTNQLNGIKREDLQFWPDNGPWWDAVGIDDQGRVLLVEAKGHPQETLTKCSAKSLKSIEQIKKAMKAAHSRLTEGHDYEEEVWFSKYYQLGNRLTFLVMLRERGIDARLILLNIVDDPTHIGTSEGEWQDHYQNAFNEMIGTPSAPGHVTIVNLRV